MSDNLNLLPKKLLDQLRRDLFDYEKVNLTKANVYDKLSEKLKSYGIDKAPFLTTRNIVETLCILKNVNYEQIYRRTKLLDFLNTSSVFKSFNHKDAVKQFDKEEVQKKIESELIKMCKKM